MVCVLRPQADNDPVRRCKRQGGIYTEVVNGISVLGSRPAIFIAGLTLPTRYRFHRFPEIRLIACIRSLHVIYEKGIDREVPLQGSQHIPPPQPVFILMEIRVRIFPITRKAMFPHLETVMPIISQQGKCSETPQPMVKFQVEIREIVTGYDLLSGFLFRGVDDGQCRYGNQFQPGTPECDKQGSPVFHQRTGETDIGRRQSYRKVSMPAFIISAFHRKIRHTGEPSPVTCRESTLIERQVTDRIGIKGRKQSTQVIGLVNGTSVDKKQVLIIFPSPDEHTGKPFRTGRHSGLQLKCLDDVRFSQKRRYVSDGVVIHYRHSHLRVPEPVDARGRLHHFLHVETTHGIFRDRGRLFL